MFFLYINWVTRSNITKLKNILMSTTNCISVLSIKENKDPELHNVFGSCAILETVYPAL